jgi:hypothetical protein
VQSCIGPVPSKTQDRFFFGTDEVASEKVLKGNYEDPLCQRKKRRSGRGNVLICSNKFHLRTSL